MKPCTFLQTASRYIDDALLSDEKARFEAHLNGCADCREFLEQAYAFRKSAETDAALDFPSAELERRMLFEANRAASVKPGLLNKIQSIFVSMLESHRLVYATAALVIGLILGGMLEKYRHPPVPSADQYLLEAAPLFEADYPGSIANVLTQVKGRGL